MVRVVIDTNVIVSALLSPQGVPSQIFRYWELHAFDLLVSAESIDELERVLHYPKIYRRLRSTNEELTEFINFFHDKALWVTSEETIRAISDALSDNLYLEIGLAGRAHYIVSGDRHLLQLKNYRGILIVPPTEFLAHVTSLTSGTPPVTG